MSDRDPSTGITRRQALTALGALCGAGALGLGAATSAHAATLKVDLRTYPALKKVGGVALVGMLNGRQVAVVRAGRKTYVALDRTCPHMGVVVNQSGSGWSCPAHGSRFDLTGARLAGPTPTGLRRLRARAKKSILTITG